MEAAVKNNAMKTCSGCGAEIAKSAKTCPQCGAKNKKPIYKRVWFIALVAIVVIGVAANIGSNKNPSGEATQTPSTSGNAPATAPQETKTYTAYDVSTLMTDLNTNPMKAEEKYSKADVTITGRLNVIDSDGKYISLVPTNEQYAIIGVQCYIKNDEQKAKVMEMSVGDTVVLMDKLKMWEKSWVTH